MLLVFEVVVLLLYAAFVCSASVCSDIMVMGAMQWHVMVYLVHVFLHRSYQSNLDTYLRLSKVQPHIHNGSAPHVSSVLIESAAHLSKFTILLY